MLTARQHVALAELAVRDARRGVREARAALWAARLDVARWPRAAYQPA